jgi:hypothetical protein
MRRNMKTLKFDSGGAVGKKRLGVEGFSEVEATGLGSQGGCGRRDGQSDSNIPWALSLASECRRAHS